MRRQFNECKYFRKKQSQMDDDDCRRDAFTLSSWDLSKGINHRVLCMKGLTKPFSHIGSLVPSVLSWLLCFYQVVTAQMTLPSKLSLLHQKHKMLCQANQYILLLGTIIPPSPPVSLLRLRRPIVHLTLMNLQHPKWLPISVDLKTLFLSCAPPSSTVDIRSTNAHLLPSLAKSLFNSLVNFLYIFNVLLFHL